MRWFFLLPLLILVAGCTQLPPNPADTQAKKFDSLPGKSVIYIVRTPMDSREGSGLMLDDSGQITTYGGTYYRWEVAPGTHRVVGFGPAAESLTLTTVAGRIYFLEHTVRSDRDDGGVIMTRLRQVGDDYGRAQVMRSQLLM